ncbi:SARP family transcriptional regulator [Virgisporangium aliadipatigenens]|uniref:SARP family transcriptional regulator n=1 Tax=Virgisporangium aliadipatigenens TaxID=741659 RepID=A0A8J3YFU0_9ACTN|nr:BTAD domain-containing putative transcriptional regulator [Virgisporangium aliadipatigenens]GIJ44389.1 SARP family transcriptional regulator [Virgisporangium aliadipatigenens]
MLECRVLGPVEVRVDGRPVDVGHARQCCVLVALLADAGRCVPPERLAHRVWGDEPPPRARNLLSGYVSRLRKTTGIDVAREGTGYVVRVDEFDLSRFDTLLARARAEADLARYDEALALWRGEPFAGLDTPWIRAWREALTARRFAAELDRTDLVLAEGGHAEVVDRLAARITAHPLDERLTGQYMLALYRCGRQADALRAYERLRHDLAEELGADPGPALRRLHRGMLRADPGVDPHTLPVPRQLPAAPRGFAGRTRELAALDAIAAAGAAGDAVETSGGVVCVVSGSAGVGKTTLAVRWAHRVADRFVDGQLHVDLRGFDTREAVAPDEAVRGFLEALGVAAERMPTGPDARVGLYRTLLHGRRMLLLLDNARDAAQVRPLLPAAPGCLVLVTSRRRLADLVRADGAFPLTLELLSGAESEDLLARRIGAARVAAERDAVDRIVERCARLPLALAVVAARAAAHPGFTLAALAAELVPREGLYDVRDVLASSYRALDERSARLFRLFGAHPGPDLSTHAAASLAGLSTVEIRRLLATLSDAHLLTEYLPGRYTAHDLLRDYARELLLSTVDSEPARRDATARVLDHYLHSACAAALALHPHRDPIPLPRKGSGVTAEAPGSYAEATRWFAAEHRVLLAVVEHCVRAGAHEHTWRLAWAMWTFLDRTGRWQDLWELGRAAVDAGRALHDPHAEAVSHRLLARATMNRDDLDAAIGHLSAALALYRRTGDLAGEANTHNNLAVVREAQGRYRDAGEENLRALRLYTETGNARGGAMALNMAGRYDSLCGDHGSAVGRCETALSMFTALGDRIGEAIARATLGHVLHGLGKHDRAVDCLLPAIAGFEALDDRHHVAESLVVLGDAHHAMGDRDAAERAWRRARAMLTELRHPDAERVARRLASAG